LFPLCQNFQGADFRHSETFSAQSPHAETDAFLRHTIGITTDCCERVEVSATLRVTGVARKWAMHPLCGACLGFCEARGRATTFPGSFQKVSGKYTVGWRKRSPLHLSV